MSRCLPFPTPEFASTESYQTALVELIKFRKDMDGATRRERIKRKRQEKVAKKLKDENEYEQLQMCRDDFGEELEKSVITEEHERQAGSCSSDSMQSGRKRKQHDDSGQRTEFRFWIPPSKHDKDFFQQFCEEPLLRCNNAAKGNTDLLRVSTPERTEAVIPERRSKIQGEEAAYRRLIEQWVPPCPTPIGIGEEDWLYASANQPGSWNANVAGACLRISSARACFLPEVDMWALPYTNLF